ncbi:unnamed protein product [Brassicogethes aeneus]|uniref:Uncharacterized protein n=1 Tax=Brassicogethes aeneus TaxID=1431903 RepID=A0A9P0BDV6_BRAAE|nr:unnamed protein product [Brassicogethes aeneus]
MQTNLYKNIENDQWPIVYTKKYNVYFLGLEKLHPFDAKKWGNIFKVLEPYQNPFKQFKPLKNFSTSMNMD